MENADDRKAALVAAFAASPCPGLQKIGDVIAERIREELHRSYDRRLVMDGYTHTEVDACPMS